MNKNKLFLFLTLVLLFQLSFAEDKWDLGRFEKTKENPIIKADSTLIFYCPVKKDSVRWAKADIFNPAAIVKNGKVYLFARCEDNSKAKLAGRTSRIGLSVSDDGINFRMFKEPVLYPQNDKFKVYDYPGGCEDPRIIETEDGLYVMTYTSWNFKCPRLSIAFSKDLFNWQKKGMAFATAYGGKFLNTTSKSGAIITKMVNDKQVAAKIKGKYWMYWGNTSVFLAWSENLYDWHPVLDNQGNMKKIISPRTGKFDSQLTEAGPPALITDKGILLIYNGMNLIGKGASNDLPEGTYSVGEVFFDLNNLEKVIERSDKNILKPSLPHEITGQYKAGTTFAEGLVYFQKNWFLYYGTADSFIGLAISNGKK